MSNQQASSSIPSPRWNYDVFLSFRGEDTRNNLTDILYATLREKGIIVFKDDQNLERGKRIASELLQAIEESRISVVVLSRNYASSTWCLDELVKILQCMKSMGQIVLPVFYDVNPSDVRKQCGTYREAFDEHEDKFKNDKKKVDTWRTALAEVANLSGWDLSLGSPQSKFIQDIVSFILSKLNPSFLPTPEDLVGIDSHLEKLSSYMEIGLNDVRIVGIHGMGGIGKTTIARTYYNRVACQFEGTTFLANVREVSSQQGLVVLQEQLLCETLKEKDLKIWNEYQGSDMIKTRLSNKRVLIVIDDVDELNQLSKLAGKCDWFGSASRIIVTTRDESLLHCHGVKKLYEVKGLGYQEALQLFRLKAFRNNRPQESYDGLSTNFVLQANGLPLALEVIGSFLCGKTLNEWRSALARMQENPPKKVMDILQINFDGLEDTEKQIFLDIACFFKGEDRDRVSKILDSCGFYPDVDMRVLIDKSLITILAGKLWMHDLLQAMGWKLVRQEYPQEPGRRSRLWLYKDIYHVFRNDTGTEKVEGMVLDLQKPEEAQLSAKAFLKMSKLRLLMLRNIYFSQGLEYLSNELRLLEWQGFPHKSLPSSFHATGLVELHMCHSRVESLWTGIKEFNKLKIVNLSYSQNLVKTPDFRGILNLEKLILEGCTRLYQIDQSIGVLESLVLLNLKDCKQLASLPSSIYGLKALKSINLSGCLKLNYILEELGHIESLEDLDVSKTIIRHTPSSFTNFKNLKSLSLDGCKGQPPRDLLWFLPGKRPIPMSSSMQSLSGLFCVTTLELSNCSLFEDSVPDNIGSMSSLISLNLSGNNFISLPASISRLSKLGWLYIDNCKRLQSLAALPSNMKYVTAQYCDSLETLPEMLYQCSSQSPRFNFSGGGKLGESQSWSRSTFIALNRYLQGLSDPRPRFDIVVPGSQIPEWFCYNTPIWCDHGWLGIALCVHFVIHNRLSFDICDLDLGCFIIIDKKHIWTHVHALNYYLRTMDQVASDHLWVFHLPRSEFSDKDWQDATRKLHRLDVVFASAQRGFYIKNYGIRLVYEPDVFEFNLFCRAKFDQNFDESSSSNNSYRAYLLYYPEPPPDPDYENDIGALGLNNASVIASL